MPRRDVIQARKEKMGGPDGGGVLIIKVQAGKEFGVKGHGH